MEIWYSTLPRSQFGHRKHKTRASHHSDSSCSKTSNFASTLARDRPRGQVGLRLRVPVVDGPSCETVAALSSMTDTGWATPFGALEQTEGRRHFREGASKKVCVFLTFWTPPLLSAFRTDFYYEEIKKTSISSRGTRAATTSRSPPPPASPSATPSAPASSGANGPPLSGKWDKFSALYNESKSLIFSLKF